MHTTFSSFVNESKHGSTVPEFWYHGTNSLFDEFDLSNAGRNFEQSVLGIYFSQYFKPGVYGSTAKEYANDTVMSRGGKPYIYKCVIDYKKPLVLDSNGWYSTVSFLDMNRNDIRSAMKMGGHDCVIAYDKGNHDGIEYADFILATTDTSIIRIVKVYEYSDDIEVSDYGMTVESISVDTYRDMVSFGAGDLQVDGQGYVTLYHGGKKLPKVLRSGEIFFMTPDIELAEDYAHIRKGKVFEIKVRPDDVRWNYGSMEVEYDKGGRIINNTIVPPKTKTGRVGGDGYEYLETFDGVTVGQKLPKSRRVVTSIIKHDNGLVQFEVDGNWYEATSTIRYEYGK